MGGVQGFSEDRQGWKVGCGLQAPTAICSKALGLAVSGPCRAQDPRIPAGRRRLRARGLALTCPAHACRIRSQPSSEMGGVLWQIVLPCCTEIKTRLKVGASGRREGRSVAECLPAPGTVPGALRFRSILSAPLRHILKEARIRSFGSLPWTEALSHM